MATNEMHVYEYRLLYNHGTLHLEGVAYRYGVLVYAYTVNENKQLYNCSTREDVS